MRRPSRACAVALVLLLSSVAAAAQLPSLVQPPALPGEAVPIPVVPVTILPVSTVPNVTNTVDSVVKATTIPIEVVQTIAKKANSAVQAPPAAGSSAKPLRSSTRASSLLNAPLSAPVAVKRSPATPAQVRPRTAAPKFELALNRVSVPAVLPSAAGEARLASARTVRLQALVQQNPSDLDADDLGQPIVRGRLVLLDAEPRALNRLQRAGFAILADVQDASLDLRMTTLKTPQAMSTSAALARLRAIAPGVVADYDHLFEPAGGALKPVRSRSASGNGAKSGTLIGMIDGGVASHPSLSGRIADQKAFAGALKATQHGTAVASLLVGRHGRFRGAASGSRLLVADVYGGRGSAGSATAIARAMSWLSSRRPRVVNISLVGPRNELVRRAVAGLRARGIEIVAAVGNDGPAAPPQYPASYPGVIAVTGVDARGAVLLEAGNAMGLDFAAPGADMAAARPGNGYVRVRGTSFAAPLAAGRLAQVKSTAQLAAEARPGKGRVGRGIVCAKCRTAPQLVDAR